MRKLRSYETNDMESFERFDIDDWDDVKQRITWRVLNKKVLDADDDLKDVIHEENMDLTIIPMISELSMDRKKLTTYYLRQSDLEKYNVTQEEVFEEAKKNISLTDKKRILSFREFALSSANFYPLLKIPSEGKMGAEDSSGFIEDINPETGAENIVNVTTKYNLFGSSFIFDRDTLKEVRSRIRGDFYIVPMSTESLMCISEKYLTDEGKKDLSIVEDDLLDMLWELNRGVHNQKDILSYRIYHYLEEEGEKILSIKQKL